MSVIELFPNKKSVIIGEGVAVPEQTKLEFWKSRNQIISDEFVTMNACQKQNILDTIISVNNELYKIVLELKGEV